MKELLREAKEENDLGTEEDKKRDYWGVLEKKVNEEVSKKRLIIERQQRDRAISKGRVWKN